MTEDFTDEQQEAVRDSARLAAGQVRRMLGVTK